MQMRLLENLSPVNPISFRKQTLWNSRHKSCLFWKKYQLQIYHFVSSQRMMDGTQVFWVWLCSLCVELMNYEVRANLPFVEVLLDASEVDGVYFGVLLSWINVSICSSGLWSLLHPNSSVTSAPCLHMPFPWSILCPQSPSTTWQVLDSSALPITISSPAALQKWQWSFLCTELLLCARACSDGFADYVI